MNEYMVDSLSANFKIMHEDLEQTAVEPWAVLVDNVRQLEGIKLSAVVNSCLGTVSSQAVEIKGDCWGAVSGKAVWEQEKPHRLVPHPRGRVAVAQFIVARCLHDVGEQRVMHQRAGNKFGLEEKFWAAVSHVSLEYDYGKPRDAFRRRLGIAKTDAPEKLQLFTRHFEAVRSADPNQLPRTLYP